MEFYDREFVLSSKRAVSKFEEFRQNSKFCDVTLQSGRAVVKAHRAVLAAASPYFEAMFTAGLKESKEELVNLPSISPDVLPSLVDFIYTGRVIIQSSIAQELMVTAHMLCLDGLVTGCARYLKTQLNTSNVLGMLSFAETLNCSKLINYTLVYIRKHWTIIAQGNELLELPLATFIKILSSDGFAIHNELEVVLAVMRWLEHDPVARSPHSAELVRHLRPGRVPTHVLNEMWESVRDTRVAESLRLSSENAVAIADTRARGCTFYIVGNVHDSSEAMLWKYDIYNKVWKDLDVRSTCRHNPGVAALGGRLYVVGGVDGRPLEDGADGRSLEDDVDGRPLEDGVEGRPLEGGVDGRPLEGGVDGRPLEDGVHTSRLLAGGEAYDPVTNELSPIAAMNEARSHFALAALKGKLYAFGGRGVNGELSSIEVYDPAADEWSRTGDLPRAMAEMSAVTYNESVFLIHFRSLLRYHPSARLSEQWHSCADMSLVRYGYGAAVLDDRLYVVGGCNNQGDNLETVERYNFAMDRWEFATPKSTRQGRCAASAAGGVLYVVDGCRLEMYDADEDRWTRAPDKPDTYDVMGAAVLW